MIANLIYVGRGDGYIIAYDHRLTTWLPDPRAAMVYRLLLAGVSKGMPSWQLIKHIIAYLCYRFFSEFIRPEPGIWLELTAYQWAAVARNRSQPGEERGG
jgi:hypothetical protein